MLVGGGDFPGRGSARQKAAALRQDIAWYGDGLARAARRAGADLLHCPTFRAPLRAAGLPVVATVHDLAVLREPGWFPAWSRTLRPPPDATGDPARRSGRVRVAGDRP